jgi:hypothetical protein
VKQIEGGKVYVAHGLKTGLARNLVRDPTVHYGLRKLLPYEHRHFRSICANFHISLRFSRHFCLLCVNTYPTAICRMTNIATFHTHTLIRQSPRYRSPLPYSSPSCLQARICARLLRRLMASVPKRMLSKEGRFGASWFPLPFL